MIEELKPCPFCGGEARLTYSTDNHKNPYVTCDTDNCPARNPYQWHYRTEDEAISAWNHRVIATERTAKEEPERKKGEWIKVGHWGRSYKCNQCGNYLDFDGVNAGRGDANFCPNCGADMSRGES